LAVAKAEEILLQELPIIPLFSHPFQALVHKEIKTKFKHFSTPFKCKKGDFL
jgi:hypothetical protein